MERLTTLPIPLADSEGDHSPPLSKRRYVMAITPDANTQLDEVRVEVGKDFKQPAADSNSNVDFKMPTKANL